MNKAKEFHLDEYLTQKRLSKGIHPNQSDDKIIRFEGICGVIRQAFDRELEDDSNQETSAKYLQLQKKAIIGYKKEVSYYKDKIKDYLRKHDLINEWHPPWYSDLVDAIYHETWGLAGIAPWCEDQLPEYAESSSAKIIGDRIYYYIKGNMVLQPQRISAQRRKQLRDALLLNTPEERKGKGEYEVYLYNGIRITMFTDFYVKKQYEDGQDCDIFIFRKYIMPDYTLCTQATVYHTFPFEAVELFQLMVAIGFNVVFTGPVRCGKTTMLACWQLEENPGLEGLLIETDPEIPLDKLMPDAPIVQLLADGEDLEKIIKPLLRADPRYIIMAEARDAIAFNTALDITDRGTRRSKLTTHFTRGQDLPASMAKKISEHYGGNQQDIACKIATNINYCIEMTVVPSDNSQKRLKAIYEYRYEPEMDTISAVQICKYNYLNDSWSWKYDVGSDKAEIGQMENWAAFQKFCKHLKTLEHSSPMDGNHIFRPVFHS